VTDINKKDSLDNDDYRGNGLFYKMTNAQYHMQRAADIHHYSSSQIKDANTDIELFHKQYITGEYKKSVSKQSQSNFDVGTYFHTAILEPHLLEEECAVWDGTRKTKGWKEFEKANEGKAIVVTADMGKIDNLIQATKESPVAMELLEGGVAELSCFVTLLVSPITLNIYSEDLEYMLTLNGWDQNHENYHEDDKLEDFIKVPVKVRADKINFEKGILVDLKSTTGNPKLESKIKKTTTDFNYALSAAMYLDVFNVHMLCSGDFEDSPELKIFWWIYSSKDMPVSKSWWGDEDTIKIGRAKWMAGVRAIAKSIRDEWEFYDEPGCLSPQSFEREWLEKPTNTNNIASRFERTEKLQAVKDEDLL